MEAQKELVVLDKVRKQLNQEAKENKVNFRSGCTYSKGNRCGIEYSYNHRIFKAEIVRESLNLEMEEILLMFREKIEENKNEYEESKNKKDKRKKQEEE